MPKHIARLIVLLVVIGAAALFAKSYFTADSFYRFGHYRANSVIEIASHEPVFQTPRYCKQCHTERVALWSAHSHKTVICEVCHGPALGHPEKRKMVIPTDTRKLCSLCHEAMPGRPRTQPQIDVAAHAGNHQCIECHNPHAPKITAVATLVTGDAAAGRKRAAACVGCHGAQGVSANDAWPNLAGQHAAYLAHTLQAYRTGGRKNVMMTSIAGELRDADVQDLAAYFGSLACKSAPAEVSVGDAAAGKAIAKNCAACHGETGISPNAAWPILARQQPGYLVETLKEFRAGLRKDPMMAGVARGLSDADIANLAAHFAAQSCAAGAPARRAP